METKLQCTICYSVLLLLDTNLSHFFEGRMKMSFETQPPLVHVHMYGATYFEALFFVKCPQMILTMYKQDSFSSKCGLPSGFYVVVLHTRRKISRFCLPSLPLTSIAASRTVICYQEFHLENNQSQNNLRFFFMINQLLIIVVGLISFMRVRIFLFQCKVGQ